MYATAVEQQEVLPGAGPAVGEAVGSAEVDDKPILPEFVQKAMPIMAKDATSLFWKWVPTTRRQTVDVPKAWAKGFESSYILDKDGGNDAIYSARAKLKKDPSVVVAVRAGPTDALPTKRKLHMAKLLSSTGSVPTLFDSVTTSGMTYTLKESKGSLTIARWIAEHEASPGQPVVPLAESLPVMIDLLRGVTAMEERGIVHGYLSEDHAYLVGDGRRGIIGDFDDARVVGDRRFGGQEILVNGHSRSVYRHAPEMLEIPSAVSNNVWQLGLVFARLVFGEDAVPSEKMASQWAESPSFLDDFSFEGRRYIMDIIRDRYALADTDAFKRLGDDDLAGLKDAIRGMLEIDPEKRLKAAEALSAVEAFAKAAKVSVPEPRRPVELPSGWSQA